jgi:hypothetical protein
MQPIQPHVHGPFLEALDGAFVLLHQQVLWRCKAQKCPKDLLLSAERDDVRMTLPFLY